MKLAQRFLRIIFFVASLVVLSARTGFLAQDNGCYSYNFDYFWCQAVDDEACADTYPN